MIPVPAQTKVWLAAGVTDRRTASAVLAFFASLTISLISSGPCFRARALISAVAAFGVPLLRPPRRSPGLDPDIWLFSPKIVTDFRLHGMPILSWCRAQCFRTFWRCHANPDKSSNRLGPALGCPVAMAMSHRFHVSAPNSSLLPGTHFYHESEAMTREGASAHKHAHQGAQGLTGAKMVSRATTAPGRR